MNFILSQIMGAIALLLMIISYFDKNKIRFFFIQLIANIFYGLSFIFSNAMVAGINSLISIVRVLLLYIYNRKDKKPPLIFILIFSIIYITVGIIFIKDYYDIITIITPILFTVAMWMKDMQIIRYFLIIPNTLLIFYSLINQVYTSALLSLLEVIILIIAIIKYKYFNKKNTKDANNKLEKDNDLKNTNS